MQPQVQTAKVAGADGFGDDGDDPGKSGEDILKVLRQMLLRGTSDWRQLAKRDVIFVVEEPAAEQPQPPAAAAAAAAEPAAEPACRTSCRASCRRAAP